MEGGGLAAAQAEHSHEQGAWGRFPAQRPLLQKFPFGLSERVHTLPARETQPRTQRGLELDLLALGVVLTELQFG